MRGYRFVLCGLILLSPEVFGGTCCVSPAGIVSAIERLKSSNEDFTRRQTGREAAEVNKQSQANAVIAREQAKARALTEIQKEAYRIREKYRGYPGVCQDLLIADLYRERMAAVNSIRIQNDQKSARRFLSGPTDVEGDHEVIQRHNEGRYCSAEDVEMGLCSRVGEMPDADFSAGTLLYPERGAGTLKDGVTADSLQAMDDVIKNIQGGGLPKPGKDWIDTPDGRAYLVRLKRMQLRLSNGLAYLNRLRAEVDPRAGSDGMGSLTVLEEQVLRDYADARQIGEEGKQDANSAEKKGLRNDALQNYLLYRILRELIALNTSFAIERSMDAREEADSLLPEYGQMSRLKVEASGGGR